MNINFGKLTEDETKEIAIEALSELRLDQRVKAVMEGFTSKNERDELRTWLDEAEEDPSAA